MATVGLGAPVSDSLDMSVVRLFEKWVQKSPDQAAVSSSVDCLTYGGLAEASACVEANLRCREIPAGSVVAVSLRRNPQTIAVLLGVWRVGAAYVPIDPDYPPERRDHILKDSGAQLLVTDAQTEFQLQASPADLLAEPVDQPAIKRVSSAPTDRLAYIIYTSGSLGTPKGVMVRHSNLTDFVMRDSRLAIGPGERVAQIAPLSFDASIFEIWATLAHGGEVTIFDRPTVTADGLRCFMTATSPDWCFLSTGLFHTLAMTYLDVFEHVGTLIAGGDVLSPELMRSAAGRTRTATYAAYGPTETTVFASMFRVDPETAMERVPIGTAMAGTKLEVVDGEGAVVPPGSVGELIIKGRGVADGYVNLPEETMARFHIEADPALSTYRTGDLASEFPAEVFNFHGRADRQVKIRGFRVEPGEVELALSAHKDVASALAVVVGDSAQSKRLVGYVVLRQDADLSGGEIHEWLSGKLPQFMVPAVVTVIDKIPLDANGKPDRHALPDPWKHRDRLGLANSYVPPSSPIEADVADVWATVLGLDRVGVNDNFFELGGDSLRGIVLVRELSKHGFTVRGEELFDHQTVSALSRWLVTGGTA